MVQPLGRVYDTPVVASRKVRRSSRECHALLWRHGESGLTEELIGKLGYIGISLILILGGLGLPIPEEAPIIVAAVLSRTGKMAVAAGDRKLLGRRAAGRPGGLFSGVFLWREGAQPAADATAADAAARSSDQGVFSPPRVQDPGFRAVRTGFPNGRVLDGRDPQAAAGEAALDRPGGGIVFRRFSFSGWATPLPTRSSRGFAKSSSGCSCSWPPGS